MKKFSVLTKVFSVVLLLCLVLSPFSNVDAAVSKAIASDLTTRQKEIVKAYVKSIETKDLSHLNKYNYPGLKYEVASNLKDTDAKIKLVSPKYTKGWDKGKKMNCLYASGMLVASDGEKLKISKVKMGIYTKTKNKVVYAYTENDNASVDLIPYSKLTKTQYNAVSKYLSAVYTDKQVKAMFEYYKKAALTDTEEVSSATSDSPVPLGSKYTWTEKGTYLDDTLEATYSATIKEVEDVTFTEVEKLGFRKPTDSRLQYKLITVEWEVKNAKLTKEKGSGETYISLLKPEVWGYESKDLYIIGGANYGFDGSISDTIREVTNYEKFGSSKKATFKATGKILLPTAANEKEGYLVLRNSLEKDSTKAKLYFSLQK